MHFGKKYFETMFYLGLFLAVIVSFNRNYEFLNPFAEGLLIGLSIVFMLVGGTVYHSDKFKKKSELQETDERLGLIRGKSYETMFIITMIIGAILAVLFALIGGDYVYITISLAVFLLLQKLIYIVMYQINSKRI
ncbi:MAG: hypothetical protein PHX62_02680 [Bacilli bacterium]|nr:hypothetical protein [Bacilli bacterium]